MAIAELKEHLAEQADALLAFGDLQNSLQQSVLRADWDEMNRVVPKLQSEAARIEKLDARRGELVQAAKQAAGLAAETAFSEMLEHLGEEDRTMLNSLYRQLQIAVWKVQNVTRGIDTYLRTRIRTTTAVLGELFPQRKGTIYHRGGEPVPADGSALVVDRHL